MQASCSPRRAMSRAVPPMSSSCTQRVERGQGAIVSSFSHVKVEIRLYPSIGEQELDDGSVTRFGCHMQRSATILRGRRRVGGGW